MTIAFDVDDTLLLPSIITGMPIDTPNYEVIIIYRWLQNQGHNMVVWSGGGVDYAKMWAEKLGLHPCTIMVKEKNPAVDLAFDDCDVDLADKNFKVKRINNHISRRAWNNHGL
jgi:phosphoserine phosphatase